MSAKVNRVFDVVSFCLLGKALLAIINIIERRPLIIILVMICDLVDTSYVMFISTQGD